MSEQNKGVLRRFFREAWSEGNLAVVDELFARDWVGHAPLSELSEPAALKQMIAAQREANPDLRFTVEAQVAEGDLVATRWTVHTTQTGGQAANPAGTAAGITLARLACGKIVEEWTNWEVLATRSTSNA